MPHPDETSSSIRSKKKAATSAALIKVARQHFFRDGYAKASMDRICSEADVTRGALYHNFGSKQGLFEAVVRQIDAEMAIKIHQSYQHEEDDFEAFKIACLAYLDMAVDPEIRRIMLQEAPSVLGEVARRIDRDGSLKPLTEALQDLMDQDRIISADAYSIACLLNGAMFDGAIAISLSDDTDRTNREMRYGFIKLLDGLLR